MNRRTFLKAAAVSINRTSLLRTSAAENKKRQPNIVLILADDMGYNAF